MAPDPRHRPRAARLDAVVFDFDGTLVDSRFVDEAAVAELIGSIRLRPPVRGSSGPTTASRC